MWVRIISHKIDFKKLNAAKKLFDLFHIFISIFIVILDDAVTPEYEMVEHYITFYKE